MVEIETNMVQIRSIVFSVCQ